MSGRLVTNIGPKGVFHKWGGGGGPGRSMPPPRENFAKLRFWCVFQDFQSINIMAVSIGVE